MFDFISSYNLFTLYTTYQWVMFLSPCKSNCDYDIRSVSLFSDTNSNTYCIGHVLHCQRLFLLDDVYVYFGKRVYVICVCLRIVVFNTYCVCFCFCFLHLVYPMLPVSLDCPFCIALSVFSNGYLRITSGILMLKE